MKLRQYIISYLTEKCLKIRFYYSGLENILIVAFVKLFLELCNCTFIIVWNLRQNVILQWILNVIKCYQYISSSEGFDAQFQPNLAKDLQKMTNHKLGKRLFWCPLYQWPVSTSSLYRYRSNFIHYSNQDIYIYMLYLCWYVNIRYNISSNTHVLQH